VVTLWGREWTREELLARVGRLEQIAGIRLVEGADGAERGVRLLRCWSGAGFDFEILVDRGFDIGGVWIEGRPLAWSSPVGLVGPWYCEPAGIGWFRGFPGGLVSTCGLDHTLHDMRAGPDGLVGAAVVNRAIGLGVFQRYECSVLPRHITWRQLGTVAYVVAMEPSTNRDAGRFDARQRGELTHLAPGEARRYRLEIGGLVGHDAIGAFARGAGDLAGQVEAPA
jgi:Domain of unknown function (DUF4432)